MPSSHPQDFDEHVPFRHPLKEKLFATELAMEFIAPFKLSWKVPKYMCNIMQIWCLLMSQFFDKPKEGKEKVTISYACL